MEWIKKHTTQIILCFLAPLIISVDAYINKFPVLYPDTIWFFPDILELSYYTPFYNFFMYLISKTNSFWGIIYIQNFIACTTIFITTQKLIKKYAVKTHLIIFIYLGCFSFLAYISSIAYSYIFWGVSVLCCINLFAFYKELSKAEKLFFIITFFISIFMHPAFILNYLCISVLMIVFANIPLNKTKQNNKPAFIILAISLVALCFSIAITYSRTKRVDLLEIHATYLTARVLDDSIGLKYMKKVCGKDKFYYSCERAKTYFICPQMEKPRALIKNFDDIINKEGFYHCNIVHDFPFAPYPDNKWWATFYEEKEIFRETIKEYPLEFLRNIFINTAFLSKIIEVKSLPNDIVSNISKMFCLPLDYEYKSDFNPQNILNEHCWNRMSFASTKRMAKMLKDFFKSDVFVNDYKPNKNNKYRNFIDSRNVFLKVSFIVSLLLMIFALIDKNNNKDYKNFFLFIVLACLVNNAVCASLTNFSFNYTARTYWLIQYCGIVHLINMIDNRR